MTLGDDGAEVEALLAALSVAASETASMPSPIDPDQPSPTLPATPPFPSRNVNRPPPSLNPAPTSRQFRTNAPPNLRTPEMTDDREFRRPSSPTNSDATSAYPSTPADSIRESFLLPHRDAYGMDSQSSSASGHGFNTMALPPLPEDTATLDKFRTINGSMSSQTSLNGYLDKAVKPSTLENAGLITRAPPQSLSSYQAQAISHKYSNSSLDSFGRYPTKSKHFSTATASTTSSTSSRQDLRAIVPASPVGTEFSLMFEDPPKLTMSGPYSHHGSLAYGHNSMATIPSSGGSIMSRTTGETASIMTTSSGDSSKKQLKQEKKA